jgi:hypothetical protein
MSTSGAFSAPTSKDSGKNGDCRVDVMAADVMGVETLDQRLPDSPNPRPDGEGRCIVKGRPPRDASKQTKQHMKAFVHRIFECAIKWGYLIMQRNPIQLVDVKGKTKHVRVLNLLTAKQWIDLIDARSSRRTSAL